MDQRENRSENKRTNYGRVGVGLGLALLLFLAGSVNLASFPAVWWDEGWTLTVARNWVERGFYGRVLGGEPSPPGLEASFPVTALIGLSFHLFGVGIWQGRLVGVLCMIGGLGLMYFLAHRLYNQKVALATLLVILFLSPHPVLSPLFIGRQVLAEMPMLFYLLGGYTFFLLALRGSTWFLGAAVFLWGICLNSKVQVIPFWFFSLLLPLGVAILQRQRKMVYLFGLGLPGSFLMSKLMEWGQGFLLQGHTMRPEPLQGMYEVIALVWTEFNRLFALEIAFKMGLVTLVGLCFAAVKLIPRMKRTARMSEVEILRLAMLILAGSWFAWYVLLSIGFPRYLFPPIFLGSLFVAALMDDLTDHFDLRSLKSRLILFLRNRRFNQQIAGMLLVGILIAVNLPPTLKWLYVEYRLNKDSSAVQTAEFLNTRTPPNALIETYDSELHFLLKRKVHYPPDQVHVELNRRTFLGEDVSIQYDPLAANPDFLVVGFQNRLWKLYDDAVASGAFRLLQRLGRYEVYERVR